MLSRSFSASARRLFTWLGYPRPQLPENWQKAVETYAENGARAKVGEIASIEILHRNDGQSPIHQSSFNPTDPELILSARITSKEGTQRTHHIYVDGTGTEKKDAKRE